MAYNYLSLVNDVNHRLNEVELTSSTFATATGQYRSIKDSVNYAIRDINNDQYYWPFNIETYTQTLTAGTNRYSFPSDYKISNMHSFRIKRDATFGNKTELLRPLTYEDYLRNFADQEYNTADTSIRDIPSLIFKGPGLDYLVSPVPDEAYELIYEYYKIPTDLELYDDVPTIPFQFRSVIVDGAMHYQYMVRGDVENTQMAEGKYRQGLDRLRAIYINRQDYISSTMLIRGGNSFYKGYDW